MSSNGLQAIFKPFGFFGKLSAHLFNVKDLIVTNSLEMGSGADIILDGGTISDISGPVVISDDLTVNSDDATLTLVDANDVGGTSILSFLSDGVTPTSLLVDNSSTTFTGAVNLNGGGSVAGGQVLTLTDQPTVATDAANKEYVDFVSGLGITPLAPADAATTAAFIGITIYDPAAETITQTGGVAVLTVDTVSIAILGGQRVLVKDQADPRENGIYERIANSGGNWVLQRTSDFDIASLPLSSGQYVFVSGGLANLNSAFILQGDVTQFNPLVGADNVTWILFTDSQNVVAGTGLSFTGETLNVGGTAGRISVGATTVDIDGSYVGQASITTLGTISSGTWNGTTVGADFGGTGLASPAVGNVLVTNGAAAMTLKTSPTGDIVGTTDTQTLTNKTLGNLSITGNTIAAVNANGDVELEPIGTGEVIVHADIVPDTASTLNVGTTGTRFSEANMSNAIRVGAALLAETGTNAEFLTVGGNHTIDDTDSGIISGLTNTLTFTENCVVTGTLSTIGDGVTISSNCGIVAGSVCSITGGIQNFLAGATSSTIDTTGNSNVICGGNANSIAETSALITKSAIIGGDSHRIDSTGSTSRNMVICGGQNVTMTDSSGAGAFCSRVVDITNSPGVGTLATRSSDIVDSDESAMVASEASCLVDTCTGSAIMAAAGSTVDTCSYSAIMGSDTCSITSCLRSVVIGGGNAGLLSSDNSILLNCTNAGTVFTGSSQLFVEATNANFESVLRPNTDNTYSCGTASFRWTDIFAVSGSVNTSDEREKTDIEMCKYGLKEILALKPVEFNWKDESLNRQTKKNIGFIAQDLEAIIPEVVYKPSDRAPIALSENPSQEEIEAYNEDEREREYDRRGLYSSQIIPILVSAIQDLHETISKLKKLKR